MSDGAGKVQHIAELDFDLNRVFQQFDALEKRVVQEGVTLNDLAKEHWNLDAVGQKLFGGTQQSLLALEKQAAESSKRIGMSYKTAREQLLEEGNTGARLTEYFKQDGQKMAVAWTEEFERHFKHAAPDLKKNLSYYLKWDDKGIHFDQLQPEMDKLFPELSGLDNHLDRLEQVNEKIKQYRELLNDRTSGNYGDRLRAFEEEAKGSATAIERIVTAYEAMEQKGAGIGKQLYSPEELQAMADGIRKNANYQTQLTMETDKAGKLTGATISYVDQLNNKYREQWRYVEQVSEATGTMEAGFEKVRGTVTESVAATQNLATQFNNIARVIEGQNLNSLTFFEKSGGGQDQIARLKQIDAQVKGIKASSFEVTREQVQQLNLLKTESDYIAQQVHEERSRKSVLAALSAEQKKILDLYAQSASLQATMRRYRLDNSGLQEEAGLLRNELEVLSRITQESSKLNAQEKERLAQIEKRVQVLQTELSIARSDSVVRSSDNSDQGLLARSGKWFGAYQVWHLAKKGATETIATIKETETAMVDIARVLDLSTEATVRLRDQIFGIAGEFGREFESAADITLRFSQAGYSASESLELTRSALLAMNTAELDAENSTKSLIGILKQWGFTAAELEGVIDKLNYTADNNSVTTQDLVDALLRASSAARNAKFSFDETVGSVVALGEATGRSGANLGTALNSLISYTQRSQSLNVFEGMGVTVWLDEQKTQMNSIMDIWQQLADIVTAGGESVFNTLEKQTDMTALYAEEVAVAAGAQEEFNAMLDAENQLNQEGLNDAEKRQVYEQFGVYRRNYMIALLNNFAKVQDVVNEMQNAEGHSMRENAKYMETLEAKYQQLIAALKELAVQAGEAGLMDLAKGTLELATNLAKATKGVGGLVPVMITLAGVIGLLKREKLSNHIADLQTHLGNLRLALKLAQMEMRTTTSVTQGLSVAFKALGPGGVISLVVMGIGLVTSAMQAYEQAQEQARQKAIDTAEQAQSQASELDKLHSRYEALNAITARTSSQEEEYQGLQQKINEALAGRTAQLRDLTYGTEEYTEALREAVAEEKSYLQADVESGRLAAAKELEKLGKRGPFGLFGDDLSLETAPNNMPLSMGTPQEYIDAVRGAMSDFMGSLDSFEVPKGADDRLQYYYALIEARKELTALAQDDPEVYDSTLYKNIYSVINQMKDSAEKYMALRVQSLQLEYEMQNGLVGTGEQYQALTDYIYEQLGANDRQKSTIDALLAETYPALAQAMQDAGAETQESLSALQEWAGAVDGSAEAVDKLKSAISQLESAMQKLAEGQGLTVDETIQLIEAYPELAASIRWVGDEWYFEADALEAVRQAKYNGLIATEAATVATQMAASMSAEEQDRLYQLTTALITATDVTARQAAMTEYLAYVSQHAGSASEGLAVSLQKMQLYAAGAAGAILSTGQSYAGSADAIKRSTEAINSQIKALQQLQKQANDASKAHIAALQKQQKASDNYYKNEIKNLQQLQKEVVRRYEAQEKAIAARYDSQIDYLKRLKELENRGDNRADYQSSRNDLLSEKADLQKRTSREAVERIKEIDKEIAELDERERRRLRDNSIDDAIAGLEKQKQAELDRVQKLKEAEQERFEAQIAAMQEAQEMERAKFEEQIEAARAAQEVTNAAFEMQIEALRSMMEAERLRAEAERENLRAVEQDTDSTTSEMEQEFWNLYERAKKYGDMWAFHQIQNNREVYENLAGYHAAMQELYSQWSSQGVNWKPNPQYPNNGMGRISAPSAHTGGYVAKEGLVNVAPGEVIVRPDITAGLARVVDYMDGVAANGGGAGPRVYVQGPLVGIEEQNIADRADLRNAGSDIGHRLMDKLNELPR